MATGRFCCPVLVLLLVTGAISLRPNVQRQVEVAAVAPQQKGTIDTSGTGASNFSRKGHEGTLEMAVMPEVQMTGSGLGQVLENDRNGVKRSIMQQHHASLVSLANQLETNPTRAAEIETTIEPILEKLETDINEGHAAAEETLTGVTDALAVCDRDWSTGRAEQQAPDAAPHLQCRQLEATRKQSYDTCTSLLSVLEISKQNACAAWALVRDEPPSAYVSPAPVASESFMAFLERVQADVVHQLANGGTLKTACDATTGDYNSKLEECEGLENIWKIAKPDCDSKQAFLESSACSFAQWADVACSTHATCIENSKALWTLEKSQLQREEASRKTSYEAMKRISCFFDVFRNSGDGPVDQGGVDSCKEASHDDQHLDLVYPPDPATPSDCSVSELPRPCSSGWTQEAYGSVPDSAPVAECTPCVGAPIDSSMVVPDTSLVGVYPPQVGLTVEDALTVNPDGTFQVNMRNSGCWSMTKSAWAHAGLTDWTQDWEIEMSYSQVVDAVDVPVSYNWDLGINVPEFPPKWWGHAPESCSFWLVDGPDEIHSRGASVEQAGVLRYPDASVEPSKFVLKRESDKLSLVVLSLDDGRELSRYDEFDYFRRCKSFKGESPISWNTRSSNPTWNFTVVKPAAS